MNWWHSLFVACVLISAVHAEEPVDYVTQVKPVLQARCYACHGALKSQANLRLDTAATAIRGGDNGAAIKPGDPAASLLLQRVTASDEAERMPPDGEPLKPAEIAAIRAWIAQGAKAPDDEQPERDPRDHWAFRVPVRPAVPNVADARWVRNPIDAFIAARHEQLGLQRQPAADKRVWLRRVTLDLIGLPPTPQELAAFVADETDEAYERVVSRLLNSPQYGERWGRHWMDIWRYSDWWGLGAEVRNSQKHIWHWRDWIIESLNADKGYDQMLREMLAADELYPNDLDRLRASGFLARHYFKFNRTTWLDEVIEHTAKSFLGMTFNCAKCHDHKYDPLTQEEYYRLRAIFEPYQLRTDAIPGVTDFEANGIPRAFDCNLDAPTFLHIRGDDRNPDKSRPIKPSVPAFLSLGEFQIEPVTLPIEAVQPGLRAFVVESYIQQAERRIATARAALKVAQQQRETAEQAVSAITKTADGPNTKTTTEAHSKNLIRENFANERPDLWEMRDGQWKFAEGKLVQSQAGSTRATLRLKPLPPADFEAKFKYVPLGGDRWKSVGITFDVTDSNEVLAYLSSVAGGSKSQVSYKSGGNHVYPPDAMQARVVELNKPHELTLRARGSLINVLVDGELSIAYRLPIPRARGHLELITFDAQAEFLAFELNELPASLELAEATSKATTETASKTLPVDQAQLAVLIAEKELAAAEFSLASVKSRAAADRAQFTEPPATDVAAQIAAAVRAERLATIADNEVALHQAELELLKATPAKKPDVEKRLASAKSALESARKTLDMPGDKYTSLAGALKTLESNLETEASRQKPFPKTSTGRRTALAQWITDPRNPLPARVAVNHLWSRHFGRPLVPTVFDFGRKGTPPTHPELLDWLAVEFVEHGWSMKHIHRLIVTSNTYRLSSSTAGALPQTLAADPDNRWHWRANPIRMEAQVVRDSLLALAGELDLTMGGPSVPVNQESNRRSLYFVHSHNDHQKFLSMFDDANVLECYRRAESIVPQQALALENSPFVTSLAEKIASRIAAAQPQASDLDFLRAAFLTVLSVEPTEAELNTAQVGLNQLTVIAREQKRPQPELRARANLIQALLNHNDFITIR